MRTRVLRAGDRAYRTLRAGILDDVLVSGAVLGEVEQAEFLGMSRTPVREALARLVADGLVVPAGRNLVVAPLSVAGVRELYELRQALEEQSVRLAAVRGRPAVFQALANQFGRADGLLALGDEGSTAYYQLIGDFDDAVDVAVANDYLRNALTAARIHLARIRRLTRHRPDRLRAAAFEHQLICEAIAAGDGSLAAHATHVHLHQSLAAILLVLAADGGVSERTA